MKFRKTKIAALTLAGVVACGALAGCALVTKDETRDLAQVIAEVDISRSEAFSGSGEFAAYADAITRSDILKRELIAGYADYGATYVSSYGYTAEQAYDLIKTNLVNRQIYLQYARAFFLKNGATVEDADGGETAVTFTKEGLQNAVAGKEGDERDIAAIAYFLSDEEKARAEYNLKVTINTTLDSREHEVIEGIHSHHHDEETSTSSSRTLPTGVDGERENYYDPAYKIYTGSNTVADCGSYEAQDESTPASRKAAYKAFLASLNSYGLIKKGENTSDVETLSYYALERKSQYEALLLEKLSNAFEKKAESEITEDWIKTEKFQKTLEVQKASFSGADSEALDDALDGVSDSNFVLYAPDGYGFVINILLPFSSAQARELKDAPADMDDPKGNKFLKRASLLQNLTATDQRSPWFTSDYAFEATEEDHAFGTAETKYLFFENNIKNSQPKETARYNELNNYLGKYAYNGSVAVKEDDEGEKKYSFNPNKITIDGFIDEMEDYLASEGLVLTGGYASNDYYGRDLTDFYKADGTVDYSKFLYYSGRIDQLTDYDANKVFQKGSEENLALSIINELSFAYNTDTAGLNSYLGYAVSPNTTDFVKEFEYAAQEAVRKGPGSVTIAPSDYGWHIMYCTFAYKEGKTEPYAFDWAQRLDEGTFSNLYFEAIKADNFSKYSEDVQQKIVNTYNNDVCVTVYVDRYSDRYEV